MPPQKTPVVPDPLPPDQVARAELVLEWRRRVEQQVGGPPEKLEASIDAAMAALDLSKNNDEVLAAALNAAAQWDSVRSRPVPRRHGMLKAFLVVVAVFLTVMIGGQLARHAGVIGLLALMVFILAVITLTRLFRRD